MIVTRDLSEALAQLRSPKMWASATAWLVAHSAPGDLSVLLPLLDAYDHPPFETSTLPLAKALDALYTPAAALALISAPLTDQRLAGIRLLERYPDKTNLPSLQTALADPDIYVQRAAARALAAQMPETETVLLALLTSADEYQREPAIQSLLYSKNETTRAALLALREHEPVPRLQRLLERV